MYLMASDSGLPRHQALHNTWHVPYRRGAISGVLLIILGIWGGLAPFWGPQFGYGYIPDTPWTFTWTRFVLQVLPAAATILGGLGLLSASNRLIGIAAGLLAAAGGAWFVVGPRLGVLFGSPPGTPITRTVLGVSAIEIGLFYGLGVAVLLLAAFGLGRFSVPPTEHTRSPHPTSSTG